ncbi:hypothetical protein D9Q98_005696 [Chlorella vulgaris]|uniref:Coenzyme Q-binding protein COQ10 START domain-containing protein n=1 Tax=Chlorella vulgaris TaxID=3077 RepID=A0A9D4YWP1_CHLVU|nr:hypothetical protein D9Q98_005696 [Chlorella vulgaris]
MQAGIRQASYLALGSGPSFLQQVHASLPALGLQLTSLTSLSRSSNERPLQQCWQRGAPAAASPFSAFAAGSTAGLSLILPPAQQLLLGPQRQQQHAQQQRRPLFNFPGFGSELSKTYHEKKLLGWTPRQVYDVVAAVEHYGKFVPWCQRSTIMVRRPGYLEAELEVGFQMFVERYTSKVTLHSPTAVHSRVEDSTLFSHLTNKWEFRLGPTPHTTWLDFEVDFAFKSPLYRQVASIFFEEVVQRMMGAFESRCALMYGPSSLQRRPGSSQPVAAGER